MNATRSILLLLCVAALPALLFGQPPATQKTTADEQALKSANLQTDGPALLAFLKSRTLTEAERENVEVLITQLGASSFKAREQAMKDLIAKGPVVSELLRQGLKSTDAEVQRRCETCIKSIKEADHFPDTPAAVIRLLGSRQPEGAVPVLLDYLPFAGDDRVTDEVRGVLARLAMRDGVADKTLITALTDRDSARRATAGEALVRGGVWQKHDKDVRALLKDENPTVRWRLASALVAARDADAVSTLIDLLPDVSQKRAWEIEETLYRLAHARPPNIILGKDETARKKCRDEWQSWWKTNGGGIDMIAATADVPLGFTTVIFLDESRVAELYPNKTLRWQIEGLDSPLDVQVLDVNRVLITEHQGNRVSERTFTGDILWQQVFDGPQMAQRLSNGNTFIAGRFQVEEVNSSGKVLFGFTVADGIMKCMKIPNGEIVCLCETGRVARFDSKGRELGSFRVDFGVPLYGGRIHVLPNGHVLIPDHHRDRVVEYDRNGAVVWQVKVPAPIAATRLTGGNTIVTCMSQNRAIEFDLAGTEIWTYRHPSRVTRAIRR